MSNRTEWVRPSEVITTGRHLMAHTNHAEAEPVFVEIIERRGEFVFMDPDLSISTAVKVNLCQSECRFMFIPEVSDAD